MVKKVNYKLLAALTSFTFSLLCLVATTLSWYSLSNTLVIDMINIVLTAGTEIEFGLKANSTNIIELQEKYGTDIGEWVDNIFYVDPINKVTDGIVTQKILEDFDYLNDKHTLSPVSSAHLDRWLDKSSINETTFPQFTKQPNRAHPQGDVVAVNREDFGYYYQFEFFMRASKLTSKYMYLNDDTVLAADVEKNKIVSDKEGFSEDQLNKVQNYLRMSILTEDDYIIYEPHPTLVSGSNYQETAFFGRMDVDAHDGFFDYDDNYKEILYGSYQNADKIVYDEEARISNEIFNFFNGGFLANTYDYAEPVDLQKSLANGLIGEYEKTLKPEEIVKETYQAKAENALAEVQHDVPTRIVVSVWAEGWDRDCNLLSQNSNFIFSLVFNATDPRSYLD